MALPKGKPAVVWFH